MEFGLDLVILDYIQLMGGDTRTENRVQEVSYISRNLKVLARELNVPVLAAAQLSRAVEQRTDKRPVLSDLRESGSIEQDADIVMFIYRPDQYEKDTVKQNVAEIIIAKHRNGPTGSVELVFMNHLAKFVDAATRKYRSVPNLGFSETGRRLSNHPVTMRKFTGFTDKETFTQIPDSFFRQLLNEIDDMDELKVTLYALWRIGHMEGRIRYFKLDRIFPMSCRIPVLRWKKPSGAAACLAGGEGTQTALYFLNSPRGRAAAEAIAKGQRDIDERSAPSTPPPERPNIFKLYEENIGPLTPIAGGRPERRRADLPAGMGGGGTGDSRQEQQAQLEVRRSDLTPLEGRRPCQKAR